MASSDQSRPPTAIKSDQTPSPSLSSSDTQATTPSPSNEFFDDVFGSSPLAGPAFVHNAATATEDIEGEDGEAGLTPAASDLSHRESSDFARLRSVHTSAGYREGLSAAKEAALQPGFDEGYSLGAALGMRAGLVVGMAEMLAVTVAATGDDGGGAEGQKYEQRRRRDNSRGRSLASRLAGIARQCRRDLERSSLLADEYIDMEGLWTWQVPANANVHQVAASHPLIEKWQQRVHTYCEALGISATNLEERWVEETEPTKTTATKSDVSPSDTITTTNTASSRVQIFDF